MLRHEEMAITQRVSTQEEPNRRVTIRGARFHWTFTLVNTGTADGDASIGFLLGGNPLGYSHFFVPQHSQVTENATLFGSGSLSPGQCPSETPGISLASVAGGFVLDIPMVIESFVRPVATIGFTGAWLGFLQYQA